MGNNLLWNEATRLFADKPVVSLKRQGFAIIFAILLSQATMIVVNKLASKNLQHRIERNQHAIKMFLRDNKISPKMFRSSACFDKQVILGDVFQEVVFRLLAMKLLISHGGMNPHLANIIQAVLFGFLHMWNIVFQEKSRDEALHQSIYASFIFFIMGYLFIYTNSILPPILVHIFINQSICLHIYEDYLKYFNLKK